ncbi:MAG: outer membrane lipoprotein-sorting protein [Gammaproteobacteria bacterium]|nr:outer membrane lipoprotein-sorting protein [Gammaproteobacteria bacterium]
MTNLKNKLLTLALLLAPVMAVASPALSGIEIMEEIYRRHQQYPYVYEQQSMVMRDRYGKRDTRKAHRYSRVEEDGSAKFMLIFDYPQEIEGVTVLAVRDPSGVMKKSVYLPAFAEQLIENSAEDNFGNFLGTDFTVENIVGEVLSDYRYERRQDRNMNNMPYFVIDVYQAANDEADHPLRRHFVRQDNFFIGQTEHLDNLGRLHKRQTYHDLKAVDGQMWRSGMILMEDVKEQHQSLLKVTRRWFSHDYVPAEMFTADWLYKNHPYIEPRPVEDEINHEEDSDSTTENDEQVSQLSGQGMEQP